MPFFNKCWALALTFCLLLTAASCSTHTNLPAPKQRLQSLPPLPAGFSFHTWSLGDGYRLLEVHIPGRHSPIYLLHTQSSYSSSQAITVLPPQ